MNKFLTNENNNNGISIKNEVITAKNYIPEKVEQLAEKYNLKCRCFYDRIYINSKRDEWIAEIENDGKLTLLHVEKLTKRHKGKHRGHFQKKNNNNPRKFYDFNFMFQSIIDHDNYKLFGIRAELKKKYI